MYFYGDIEDGFLYEQRRNLDFVQDGVEHRIGASVFRHTDKATLLKSGRPAARTLVTFVDDHIILGHFRSNRNFSKRFEGKAGYKEPFRPIALGAIEPLLGIEFTASSRCSILSCALARAIMAGCGWGGSRRSSMGACQS